MTTPKSPAHLSQSRRRGACWAGSVEEQASRNESIGRRGSAPRFLQQGKLFAYNKSVKNYPATWHQKGDDLSFADGHAEHWRWLEAQTLTIKTFYVPGLKPYDRDLQRVIDAYATRE